MKCVGYSEFEVFQVSFFFFLFLLLTAGMLAHSNEAYCCNFLLYVIGPVYFMPSQAGLGFYSICRNVVNISEGSIGLLISKCFHFSVVLNSELLHG